MEGFTPFSAIVGGALIGLSASLLWIANGRIAGVSGIVGGVLAPVRGDVAWRGMFLVGLLAAPLLYRAAGGVLPDLTSPAPVAGVIAAGLLLQKFWGHFNERRWHDCSKHLICNIYDRWAFDQASLGGFRALLFPRAIEGPFAGSGLRTFEVPECEQPHADREGCPSSFQAALHAGPDLDVRSTFAVGRRSGIVRHRRLFALHAGYRQRWCKPAPGAAAVGCAAWAVVRATGPVWNDFILSRPSEQHARI